MLIAFPKVIKNDGKGRVAILLENILWDIFDPLFTPRNGFKY